MSDSCKLQLSDSEHTLDMHAGDIVLLTGDAGCGKSVWLKRMAGLTPLPKGMSFSSTPIVRMQFDRWPHVWLGDTVEEELMFGLKHQPSTAQLKDALSAWGLSDALLCCQTHQLNRLQCIRVSLAAMALATPNLVLLDNPSAALSEDTATDLAKDITAWAAQSNTIVVVASNRWHDWRTVVTQTWHVSAPDVLPTPSVIT